MRQLQQGSMDWRKLGLRALVLVLSSLILSACASIEVGTPFDLQRFESHVQRGVTTESMVRAWLGAPGGTGVGVDADGTRYTKWTYYYGHGSMSGGEAPQIRYLEVQFDAGEKVRAYNWSQ
jgi:hypothetical protein